MVFLFMKRPGYSFPLLILFILIFLGKTNSQDLVIKSIELDGEKVFAKYDLVDSTSDRTYTVNLYSSNDNFLAPLKKVTGEVGLEIKPGTNRVIEWNAREELGVGFNGDVAIELRAKVYIPFIRLDGFDEYKKIVRGRSYEILWRGGRPQNVLHFDLYRANTKVHTFSNIANEGKYLLIIPVRTKLGKDYYFQISDSKNKDEVVVTAPFRVAPKIPLPYKIIPIVGLGAFIVLQLSNQKDLPDFPGPPSKK